MRLRIIFFLISLFLRSTAQEAYPVTGTVKSMKDSSVLSYASIGFPGVATGAITNSEGTFDFICPAGLEYDTLCFAYLGYEKKCLSLKDIIESGGSDIYLLPAPINLREIPIEALTAKSLVKDVIKNIPVNYPSAPYCMKGWYRQVHKENGKYIRLIEAVAEILDQGYSDPGQELIRIKKMRRSDNRELNKEQHGDHFVDLLLENPVRHTLGTVLNKRSLDQYNFHFDTTFITADSALQCIRFTAKNPGAKLEKGRMYIDLRSKVILSMEIETSANPHAREAGGTNPPYEWKFIDGRVFITFYKDGEKWFPGSIVKSYRHALINTTFHSQDFLVEEFFEWHREAVLLTDSLPVSGFTKTTSLYSCGYEYDAQVWEHYSNRPLPETIKSDLEKERSLEEQFRKNAK